ncbi:PP2C family serine/threonine-protein phosphatase [Myceligenerans salitolerans]|uniref:Protein phosphatase 2C domain-containing protein n=1 Tax=Myceligenerans salitolerans TaxID=1230528 RepID=A0ABS3I4B4_9MICO|nr:PP2C family serine/threonine-protein phosphatase [Myceligenerans salitolerans]MBO0607805.1 protein phosphatase 2C domain-containing protein [Myceligenerans salitolerans]
MSTPDENTKSRCPRCGELSAPGARFCEQCGFELRGQAVEGDEATGAPPTEPIPVVTVVDPDPDSSVTPPPPRLSARDHFTEKPSDWVAGVCDRGVRHARNEDAMALAAAGPGSANGTAALVVCDGVSSAPNSDVASLEAARVARDALVTFEPVGSLPVRGKIERRVAEWTQAMVAASRAAGAAVVRTGDEIARGASSSGRRSTPAIDPPACTFAAAVVDSGLVVAGWLGDSRVYWLPDDGVAEQLSVDDSWAQEMMAAGFSREQAEHSPQSHAITRWLGRSAPDHDAHCAAMLPEVPGWVLVCSDGLWNYCSEAEHVADLVHRLSGGTTDPSETAAALVLWANAAGGRDNITVALARVEPGRGEREGTDAEPADAEPAA